jgi:predicted ester cyclase
MSTDHEASNEATSKRFTEAVNSGDTELIAKTIDELIAPDALIGTPLPIEATGAELAKQLFARLLRAYPDPHITVEDLIAEGANVVSRNTVTGTHRGEHLGVPPTVSPSATTRSSSLASRTAESPRPGRSSMSSRRCGSSARFPPSEPDRSEQDAR